MRDRASLVRASELVSRIRQFVHSSEKTLGQLVELAFTDLICLDGDVHVVAAFRAHRDAERAERALVAPRALVAFRFL